MGLKSFSDMKKQAIAHWKDNLKRVKAMNWEEWLQISYDDRIGILLRSGWSLPHYPLISGDVCPYCKRYSYGCKAADGEQCPLRQRADSCCPQWVNVRESLLRPTNKRRAIQAIKAMIEYIKERG